MTLRISIFTLVIVLFSCGEKSNYAIYSTSYLSAQSIIRQELDSLSKYVGHNKYFDARFNLFINKLYLSYFFYSECGMTDKDGYLLSDGKPGKKNLMVLNNFYERNLSLIDQISNDSLSKSGFYGGARSCYFNRKGKYPVIEDGNGEILNPSSILINLLIDQLIYSRELNRTAQILNLKKLNTYKANFPKDKDQLKIYGLVKGYE